MPTVSLPEMLIMGDSHTAALDMAVRARGYSTALLYINGNYWHAGGFVHDPERGIALPGNNFIKRRVALARGDMGGRLFRKDAVVLASIGYHLGRLCPALGRRGHKVDEASFDADPDASFMSASMMEALVTAQRAPLWDLLAAISKECELFVVAPPILTDDPMSWQVAQFVTRSLRERRLRVWDPRDLDGPLGKPLTDEWRAQDGVHGNIHYGLAVLEQLLPQNCEV